MDKEAAERTAAVLAPRALSLLDGVDAGGSLFACRLSEALDVAVPNATDMAPRSSMMELVSPGPHAATPLATFGLADGQVVAINPATVSHLCSDDFATTIRFLDGSQVQLKVPYEKVVMGLGLPSKSQPPANGFMPVNGARHVLRNLLTIVSATTNQVLDGDEPLLEKGRELSARVAMLSRISDLIVQPEAHVTDLQTLVELALAEGGRSRVRIVGSPVPVGPSTAAALALAVHELEVHSLRYGALSEKDGYVSLRWEVNVTDQPHIWLQWAERDGPQVRTPLCTWSERLLEVATPKRLGGVGGVDDLPTGLIWSLHAPVAALQA